MTHPATDPQAMFVNPEIPLESLPGATQLDWVALHPRFVRCLQVKALLRWAVLTVVAAIGYGAAVVFEAPAIEYGVFWAGWVLLAAGAARALAWPLLDVRRRGYVVRDKDIVYKSGVLWRSVKAVPYNRVQHAETASGPVDRRFDLARLTIFTAGGSGGDVQISGLDGELAERLRAHIVGKLDAAPTAHPVGNDQAVDLV